MHTAGNCYHCGDALPGGAPIIATIQGVDHEMCCIGCKAVAEFIDSSGLTAFYRFRDAPDPDLNLAPAAAAWKHYDSANLQTRYVHRDDGVSEATIDIGGMYCSACVWLFDNGLKQLAGIESASVSPATHRAVIRWRDDSLEFSELLAAIARIGFRPSPVNAGQVSDLKDDEYRRALKRLIVAAAAGMQVMMFAVALYAGDHFGIEGGVERFLRYLSLLVTVPIVFYSARPFFASAWRGLRARSPGMDLPVSIAVIAAFAASAYATWADRGEIYFDSVAMFVFFLSATRFLEMRARHRSDDHATALARLLPDTALRVSNGSTETVALDRVVAGDMLGIRPGDVVPADGELAEGSLSVDESMLTGESLPLKRRTGDPVFAGSVVRAGNATICVQRAGASTSLAEIGRMLERARADRPPVALLADRIARYFVAAVLTITGLAASGWYWLDTGRAFEVALATLVVTCPCALALATPAAIAAATGRLARSGFLLVRSRILEVLATARAIVLDKTGTLTEGRPRVVDTYMLSDHVGDKERLLALAAAIESASEHVLARAFSAYYEAGRFQVSGGEAVPGCGVEATVDGQRYRIGAAHYVQEFCAADTTDVPDDGRHSRVFLGNRSALLASFAIGDELRSDAVAAITALKQRGFRPIIASGDREVVVRQCAETLGIDEWHGGLSPASKLDLVRRLRKSGEAVVMVGDGINDAPVLAAADASIALDAGTALARASADAVSLGRTLGSIVVAADIAADTQRIIRQNIAWAIIYNLTAVPLAVSGFLAPWMAAIGMSASSFVVVLNALRLHRARLDADRLPRRPRSGNQRASEPVTT